MDGLDPCLVRVAALRFSARKILSIGGWEPARTGQDNETLSEAPIRLGMQEQPREIRASRVHGVQVPSLPESEDRAKNKIDSMGGSTSRLGKIPHIHLSTRKLATMPNANERRRKTSKRHL